jgi:short-subunit dehydrogenase
MSEKELVVITGCDSGIGKSLAGLFLKKGFAVAISYLKNNPFKNSKDVFAKKMDLRIEKEVNSFCVFLNKLCKKGFSVTHLISNAGVALCGPVENVPLKTYRESFEINFFALVTVVQKMIPEMIKSRGRIVIIGSFAGRMAAPFSSPYSASKYALEGFTESLRREMNPFGIKTVIFEPGSIATPIWNKIKEKDYSFIDKKYNKTKNLFIKNFVEAGNRGLDPETAALKIYSILTKRKPGPRYIIAENAFMEHLKLIIPTRLMDYLIAKIFEMNYGEK